MKPLVLTVYPPLSDDDQRALLRARIYNVGLWHTPPPGYFEMKAKRLTSAELAAEYWRAHSDVEEFDNPSGSADGTWPEGYLIDRGFMVDLRLETIERFATLPHASERNYE